MLEAYTENWFESSERAHTGRIFENASNDAIQRGG